ncbi:MAG: hypothetical protein JO251_12500 [Verrucomicrobia bacterium]|nr:hypothetical protein [Verrucomicrobiota bacterium]
MAIESQVQQVVHSIEHGNLAGLIRVLLAIVGVVALALAYLFIEFKGLSAAEGMDQAQIARELAAGHGFSTKCLRPLAIQQIQRETGRIPSSNFPDTYQAPLNPLIDALVLRIYPKPLAMKITTDAPVFAGDRLIASVSVFFFVLSVAVTFVIGSMLFDRKVALTACGLVIVADQFWQFALSGLPQMLMLFLFSCAALCLVVAIKAKARGKRPLLIFFPLGICLGLMTLTHPAALWLIAGTALFCGAYFRPRVLLGLIPIIICLGMFSIWIIRDYQVAKAPFGVSPYALLEKLPGPEGAWMRQGQPDLSTIDPLAIRKHAIDEVKNQFGSLYLLLGGVVVAPLFFVSLLHGFKRTETADFRWAILLLWLFAFAGSALLGVGGRTVDANQFHLLFGPLMALYGVAFVLVLWNRLNLQTRFLRTLFLGGLFVLTGLPALLGFSGGGIRANFPPYLPPFMQLFTSWTNPEEIICSDMPWAVAWYADRKALLLPAKISDFNDYNDYQSLGGPIVGLYFSPITRDAPFASGIIAGEYKDWAALVLGGPQAVPSFPLRIPMGLAQNRCFYLSDRIRWSQDAEKPADAQKAK